MDAPIANDWERLKALASDRTSWRKRVNDLKVKMTKIKQPCRNQSTRSQRLSPLKIKRREQLRKKHFAAVKKTLSKNLQQTDIRAYFKPAKPKIDNSGGGAAAAFAAAARQNKNANVKYTFVPKEPKRKKGLDGGVRKKQNKVKKKTDEEAREAHYQRLKGEKTFLGCKWPTEAAVDMDSTMTITGAEATTIHTTHTHTPTHATHTTQTYNTTPYLKESAYTTPANTHRTIAPSMWCEPAQLNDTDSLQLSTHTPTIPTQYSLMTPAQMNESDLSLLSP